MASGLQSWQIATDTDVRTRDTDDSMKSYDIDLPSVVALEERLPFQGRQMNQNPGGAYGDLARDKNTQPLNPYTQLDPFSIDPYVSDALEIGDVGIDPGTISMGSFDPTDFEEKKELPGELSSDEDYKNRLLTPQNSFDSLITTEPRGFMND